MNGNLIKFEVKRDQLTLTIQLSTGEEIIVQVTPDTAEVLGNDIYQAIYCGGETDIAKVTRTVTPDGSVLDKSEDAVEYEEEN